MRKGRGWSFDRLWRGEGIRNAGGFGCRKSVLIGERVGGAFERVRFREGFGFRGRSGEGEVVWFFLGG